MSDDSVGELDVRVDSLKRELGVISQAIVASNDELAAGMGLVARIEVQRDELVEFYVVGPGRVLVSGAGAPERPDPDVTAFRDQRLSVEELWNRISSNAAMPSELAVALAEAPAAAAELERNESVVPSPLAPAIAEPDSVPKARTTPDAVGAAEVEIGTLRQAHIYGGWCDNQYYQSYGLCDSPYTNVVEVCYDHATWNNGGALVYEAQYLASNACAVVGNVIFTLYWPTPILAWGQWTVLTNTVRWVNASDWGCTGSDCIGVSTIVSSVQPGEEYHYRFRAVLP